LLLVGGEWLDSYTSCFILRERAPGTHCTGG